MHQIQLLQDGSQELSASGRGGKYAASGVMEIVYEEESFTNEPDAGWNLQNYQESIL